LPDAFRDPTYGREPKTRFFYVAGAWNIVAGVGAMFRRDLRP
jgi:hypothetical protein